VVAPSLYRIDPSTGKATLIAPTALNLGASVALDSTFYAFHLGQVVTLDLSNGNTHFVTDIDPVAPLILGAAPVPTPEPGSVGLVLVGVAAIATRRRRTI
jgi:hypothetical protein